MDAMGTPDLAPRGPARISEKMSKIDEKYQKMAKNWLSRVKNEPKKAKNRSERVKMGFYGELLHASKRLCYYLVYRIGGERDEGS